MLKCDFNKVALQITLWRGCSLVYLLFIFRTHFLKNTSNVLVLKEKAFCRLLVSVHYYFYIFNRPAASSNRDSSTGVFP